MENEFFEIMKGEIVINLPKHVVYISFTDDDDATLFKQWITDPKIISQFEVFKNEKAPD